MIIFDEDFPLGAAGCKAVIFQALLRFRVNEQNTGYEIDDTLNNQLGVFMPDRSLAGWFALSPSLVTPNGTRLQIWSRRNADQLALMLKLAYHFLDIGGRRARAQEWLNKIPGIIGQGDVDESILMPALNDLYLLAKTRNSHTQKVIENTLGFPERDEKPGGSQETGVFQVPEKKKKIDDACLEWVNRGYLPNFSMTEFLKEFHNKTELYLTVDDFKRALRDAGERGIIEKGDNGRWKEKITRS